MNLTGNYAENNAENKKTGDYAEKKKIALQSMFKQKLSYLINITKSNTL